MTEDTVAFRFRQRSPDAHRQQYLDLDPDGSLFGADEVILFSGGLDSFAGALEALSTTTGRVVLVTHRSAPKAIPRQVKLGRYLADRFPNRVLHVHVRATRVGSEGSETTQRSRSFLFAALGHVVARTLGAKRVSFYENGIISHNLPISPQVIGSMATRTTHPMTLAKLNALMSLLGPEPVPIRNEYQWLNKSEVVANIMAHGGTDCIRQAVSCTNIRDQDTLHTHCGACSQCIDRRFATLANGLGDADPDIQYRTDVLLGERTAARSQTMAVEWTRHSLRFRDMDKRTLLREFGQEISRIVRGHEDLAPSDALARAQNLYARQAAVVHGVLSEAFRARAEDLAAGTIPPTSLLVLHVGAGRSASPDLPADPRPGVRCPEPLDDVEEVDTVPDADRPIEVSFRQEGPGLVIAVRGLCVIVGQPARVAGALKPRFDEDRKRCCGRAEHAFVTSGDIAKDLGASKDMVTQNVKRCRDELSSAYRDVFGRAPQRPLLIESRRHSGYRLDPDIRVID